MGINLNFRRLIVYTLFTGVVGLVVLEVLLSLVGFSARADDTRFVLNPEWDYPEFFLKDRELFWRFRPHQTIRSGFFVEGEYRINSHGLRGPEFSPTKTPGTFRIVCLGNSCTFGWQVAEDEVYPRRLEKQLKAIRQDLRYEVINAGVTGYSSLQGLRFFKRDVLSWDPDLIVLSFGWNDHWAGAQNVADKDQPLPSQWVLNLQNLFGRTSIYRWLKYLIFTLKNPPPADFSRTQPVYRVELNDFRINLLEIIKHCQNRNIQVLLLTAPIAPATSTSSAGVRTYHEKYNRVIRALGTIPEVALVDAARGFAAQEGFFDDPEIDLKHYNVKGHNFLAMKIAEFITGRD